MPTASLLSWRRRESTLPFKTCTRTRTLSDHFLFFKTLDMVHTEGGFGESFVYHNFFAKATTCAKEIENPDPKKCRFRNDRPLVDCVVCYMGLSDNIARETKPYVSR
ncbi:hypothetical protein GN956_G26696 [Arapaima gigas]